MVPTLILMGYVGVTDLITWGYTTNRRSIPFV